jgi:hypothetical protein
MASLEGTRIRTLTAERTNLTGLVIKIQPPNAEETRPGLRSIARYKDRAACVGRRCLRDIRIPPNTAIPDSSR